MIHVCGPSCWKYNKTGTRICRHHSYHIVVLEPDPDSEMPAEKQTKLRRDGKPLNNQLFVQEEAARGKRGRIAPIVVMPFETMTNYIVAASLRCNFDNQSLLYLPPRSVLPLAQLPNIGPMPEFAWMSRTEGDLEPKWLLDERLPHTETEEGLGNCEELMQELEAECRSAFQDAHNTGFYINQYTTKINALGDALMQGLRRACDRLQSEEATRVNTESSQASAQQKSKQRIAALLRKMVHLMNSLQVKSGSELVFPMMYDHMSFATHRTWEVNLRVAYAKTLNSWEKYFDGSLRALRKPESELAQAIGFVLPTSMTGKERELPPGWLLLPAPQPLASEIEDMDGHIYISPQGCRFTSLAAALQHAKKRGSMDHLASRAHTLKHEGLDASNSVTVQFTSNHEDYMHRCQSDLLAPLPAYVYNMWVYTANKKTDQDPHRDMYLDIPFSSDYRAKQAIKIQRLSIVPRVPEISGISVPSPDIDPHKNCLVKLLLFKPYNALDEMDDQGNPLDPYQCLFTDSNAPGKRCKKDPDCNPYDAFVSAWQHYWTSEVLPHASAADAKIAMQKNFPTIWETAEVCNHIATLAAKTRVTLQAKLAARLERDSASRLTLPEYCAYIVRKIAANLDAYARAKSAPRTKSYAIDADAVDDPTIYRSSAAEDNAELFDAAQDDALDPDDEGIVKLKAGEAPLKVHHALSQDGLKC